MNLKKTIVLLLSLLLPVAIFIFLKSFGRNEFKVEPLFQETIPVTASGCAFEYVTPYSVPDSVLQHFNLQTDSLILIVFDDSIQDNRKRNFAQLARVFTETSIRKVYFLSASDSLPPIELLSILKMDPHEIFVWKNCIMLMGTNNGVLIDGKRKILGQYNLLDLDEADRLIMESKIILKEY
jgi:hypothetical protein